MSNLLIIVSVIFLRAYVAEQAYFLKEDFINNINAKATTWKVSGLL